MEDEEDWLIGFRALLLLNIFLMFVEEFGVKLDVAWLVDTVYVTEACGNREVRADLGECGPDLVNILWLGVQGVVVDIFVVDTILFTTRDANFLSHVR